MPFSFRSIACDAGPSLSPCRPRLATFSLECLTLMLHGLVYTTAPEGYMLYMGKDKVENEELIKFAWPEDIWYHVDKESSAHVYIRLPR